MKILIENPNRLLLQPEKCSLVGSESYTTKTENLFWTKIGGAFTLKNPDLGMQPTDRVSGPKKSRHNFRGIGPISLICYVKSSTLSNERKK